MMQRILRCLVGLASLFFLAMGLMLLFSPRSQTGQFAVLSTGTAGLGTLRGDLGGLFLGMAVFALGGAVAGSIDWLAVPAVFLGFILLGRLLNLMLDGRSGGGMQSLTVELVLAAVLTLTILSLRRGKPRGSGAVPIIAVFGLAIVAAGAALVFQRQIGARMAQRGLVGAFENQLLPSLPDGLHAGLCGSGSPLPDPTRAGPCVFVIAGKHVYIVDTGDGSARKLALTGLPPGLIDAVFLTHFHSDHIAGLGDMMIQRWGGGSHKDPLPVVGPQGVETVVEGFNAAYSLDKDYRVAHHGESTMPPSGSGGVARPFTLVKGSDEGQTVWQQDGLTVMAFGVNHTPVFPAVGYRFDYKGRSVVISGDTAPSPVLLKYARGADVLFHEGLQTTMVATMRDAFARTNRAAAAKIMADIPSYHTRPEDAARIAQQAGVKYLMFYHTIPPLPATYFNAAFLGDAPTIYKGPITVGRDGMVLSLPAGSSAITLRERL